MGLGVGPPYKIAYAWQEESLDHSGNIACTQQIKLCGLCVLDSGWVNCSGQISPPQDMKNVNLCNFRSICWMDGKHVVWVPL